MLNVYSLLWRWEKPTREITRSILTTGLRTIFQMTGGFLSILTVYVENYCKENNAVIDLRQLKLIAFLSSGFTPKVWESLNTIMVLGNLKYKCISGSTLFESSLQTMFGHPVATCCDSKFENAKVCPWDSRSCLHCTRNTFDTL